MAELEQLEQEELDSKLLDVGPTPAASLPEVPKGEPAHASRQSNQEQISHQEILSAKSIIL